MTNKLYKTDNSAVVTGPTHLDRKEGDKFSVGDEPYDPHLKKVIEIAERIMERDREALEALAKC